MYNKSKSSAKPDEKKLIELFVKHLASQGNPDLKVDSWPDEERRDSPDIDAIAGDNAIEHTSVDTVANQRRDAAWFVQAAGSLEDELRGKLRFRLKVILPYKGIQKGQDWSRIKTTLNSWILNESSKLSEGSHSIGDLTGVPFEFRVIKRLSGRPGVFFARTAPEDHAFSKRVREQLARKVEKLARYKEQGKTTILLVESEDIALMDEAIMLEGIKSTYPRGLPEGVDQICFADTSIAEEILFHNLTTAITR